MTLRPAPPPPAGHGSPEGRIVRGVLVAMLAVGIALAVWLLRQLILIACALVALMFGERNRGR